MTNFVTKFERTADVNRIEYICEVTRGMEVQNILIELEKDNRLAEAIADAYDTSIDEAKRMLA